MKSYRFTSHQRKYSRYLEHNSILRCKHLIADLHGLFEWFFSCLQRTKPTNIHSLFGSHGVPKRFYWNWYRLYLTFRLHEWLTSLLFGVSGFWRQIVEKMLTSLLIFLEPSGRRFLSRYHFLQSKPFRLVPGAFYSERVRATNRQKERGRFENVIGLSIVQWMNDDESS